jgi:hypothetical protein
MLIASLAWSKAWCALLLPVYPRFHHQHEAEQLRLLRMDCSTPGDHSA